MSTILIDLDGTLYEWDPTARWMLRNIRGCTDPALDEESSHWHYIQEHITPDDWDWLWTEGVKRGLFRHGHVTTGGMHAVQQLKAMGHTLIVATARPAAAMRDTLSWLDHHFGSEDPYPWSGIHILSDGQPKSALLGDILIDDKPDNLREWIESGRLGLLMRRPWNYMSYEVGKWCVNATSAWSWEEAVAWISTLS